MKFYNYNNIVSSRSGLKLQSSANEMVSLATTKPAAPVTKSQLQAAFRASQSPVVQNAIIEWNKFNKIVRTLTRSTKVQKSYQCNYYVIIIIIIIITCP